MRGPRGGRGAAWRQHSARGSAEAGGGEGHGGGGGGGGGGLVVPALPAPTLCPVWDLRSPAAHLRALGRVDDGDSDTNLAGVNGALRNQHAPGGEAACRDGVGGWGVCVWWWCVCVCVGGGGGRWREALVRQRQPGWHLHRCTFLAGGRGSCRAVVRHACAAHSPTMVPKRWATLGMGER